MLGEILRRGLIATAAVAGAVLVARAFLGPFHFGLSISSPMNAESIFSASVVLALLLSGDEAVNRKTVSVKRWQTALACFVFAMCLWDVFLPALRVGFLADDYAHVLAASKADLATVAYWFTVPASDNIFFRPVAMASYWADAHWAGDSAMSWHVAEWALHCLNALLVFALGRRLGLELGWALAAAALFGVHGTRPEAVAWVAARFDLLATLFVLLALHGFLSYRERPRAVMLAALLLATICGLYSKESAFVLPLLMAALVWYFGRRAPDLRAIAAVVFVALAAFLYRWHVLGGIGGYKDATGQATIGQFRFWLTVKALALRLWAVLFVPINWSDEPGRALRWTLVLSLAAVVVIAWRGKCSRLLRLGFAFTLIAALPVYHLLLIGADLEKSRVVYLGSVGFAIAIAAAARSLPARTSIAAFALILAFQIVALWHNIAIWQRISRINDVSCNLVAVTADRWGAVAAVGMPNTLDGVYLLRTGLPECAEMRALPDRPRNRPRKVLMIPNVEMVQDLARQQPDLPILFWNDKARAAQFYSLPIR